jgi:hypothetical protein
MTAQKKGGGCINRWGERKCIPGFGKKCEGKRPLGRTSRVWKVIIKIDLKEMGLVGVNLSNVAKGRDNGCPLVNTVLSSEVL